MRTLIFLFWLIPTTAAAMPPVWSSPPCGNDVVHGLVCGRLTLPCTVLWSQDVAPTMGLETAWRCQSQGVSHYVLVDRDQRVMLDSGDTNSAVVGFVPEDIVEGGYPEILLTYTRGDFVMSAIVYFDNIMGNERVVYAARGTVTVEFEYDTTFLYGNGAVWYWSVYEHDFMPYQGDE